MKGVCVTLFGCLLLIGSGQAGDKKGDKAPDKTKLYGVWEVLKSDEYPLLSSAEFKKKRLVRTYFKGGATTQMIFDYTLEGNKLTTTIDTGGKVTIKTMIIQTLTDTSLVLVNEKEKTAEEFRRKR
jgi:uncharacterized protein (TIGR03066 family)